MDTQVTTFVQQLDAQGPVVVERVSTQFADLTCTAENARKLVEALHSGTSVTLTADGKTATFAPKVNLGYGEAYIAMALAAEALRNAGVSGCATPDQWQAVLMGGPLSAAGTTTSQTTTSASASSSSQFPGILALRSQGQGWGQIAQTTNVQLGQIMSSARSSFNLGSTSTSSDASLTPTGRSSAEMNKSATGAERGKGWSKGQEQGQRKGQDVDRDRARSSRDNPGASSSSTGTSTSSSSGTLSTDPSSASPSSGTTSGSSSTSPGSGTSRPNR